MQIKVPAGSYSSFARARARFFFRLQRPFSRRELRQRVAASCSVLLDVCCGNAGAREEREREDLVSVRHFFRLYILACELACDWYVVYNGKASEPLSILHC